MSEKCIIAALSETQRITLKQTQGSIILLKEWRKNDAADWMVGKGIEIPNVFVSKLVDSLCDTLDKTDV